MIASHCSPIFVERRPANTCTRVIEASTRLDQKTYLCPIPSTTNSRLDQLRSQRVPDMVEVVLPSFSTFYRLFLLEILLKNEKNSAGNCFVYLFDVRLTGTLKIWVHSNQDTLERKQKPWRKSETKTCR